VETIVTAIVPEWAEGSNGIEHRLLSHKGYFTILNMTEYGHKRPLTVALDIRDDKARCVYIYIVCNICIYRCI